LTRLLAPFAPFERMKCLSPYHDSHGAPLSELIAALNISALDVAVDPVRKTAPFNSDDLHPRPHDLRFVLPKDAHGRSLHAKWIEFHRPGRVSLMSGSANATKPALSSLDNVEAVVVRLQATHLIDCAPTEPLAVERHEREMDSLAFDGYVIAIVSGNGTLTGRIDAPHDLEGEWNCSFTARHQAWTWQTTNARADGAFSLQMANAIEESCAAGRAIQLRMSRNGINVAGWVSF